MKILLKVATGVHYLPGLHGSCSTAQQPSAQCPGSVIEPRLNSFLHNFNNEPMTYWSQSVYKWP